MKTQRDVHRSIASSIPTLAGEPIELLAPRSLARRWGVHNAWVQAGSDAQKLLVVSAAALGLSWPRFMAKKETPAYKQNLLEFGEQVYDFLMEHGATHMEIMRWGNQALHLCSDGLVTEAEVKAAEDFLGDRSETSSGSSSRSSESEEPSTAGSQTSQTETQTQQLS